MSFNPDLTVTSVFQSEQPAFLINHLIGVLAWVLKPLAERPTVNGSTVHVPVGMYS